MGGGIPRAQMAEARRRSVKPARCLRRPPVGAVRTGNPEGVILDAAGTAPVDMEPWPPGVLAGQRRSWLDRTIPKPRAFFVSLKRKLSLVGLRGWRCHNRSKSELTTGVVSSSSRLSMMHAFGCLNLTISTLASSPVLHRFVSRSISSSFMAV